MKGSLLILSFVGLLAALACLAATASAECAACQGEQNWTASATSFLEGKPVNETAPVWGPKAERMKNSRFSTQSDANDVPADSGESSQPRASIELVNASATPNPVKSGSNIKIVAMLKENDPGASPDQTPKKVFMTATATISDSKGIDVGRLSLQQSDDNEYSDVWNARSSPGIYNATIVASSLQASATFKDALKIEIIAPETAAENSSENSSRDL